MDRKTCSRCGQTKPLSAFKRANRRRCAECDRQYMAEYHIKNYPRTLTHCAECGGERRNGDGKGKRCPACRQKDEETQTRWCGRCSQRKPWSDFHSPTETKGVRTICRRCGDDQQRRRRLALSGIPSSAELVCARCGRAESQVDPQRGHVKRLAIDHDHGCCQRGCVRCTRGLLCMECNIRIGYIEKIEPTARLAMLLGDLRYISAGVSAANSSTDPGPPESGLASAS